MKIEVNSAADQKLFQQAMKDDPDLRTALMEAMRSGMQPAEAIAALVSQVKGVVGDAAGVAQPMLLSEAVEQNVATRQVLSKNRRTTAGEKASTLKRVIKHLEEVSKKDLGSFRVHDVKRSILVEFVLAYATNPRKDDIRELKIENDALKSGKAQKATATDTVAEVQGLSSRTITKAVGHLNGLFHFRPRERLGGRQPSRQGV